MEREREVVAAFVSLADSMGEQFDVIDVLTGLAADCARLIDTSAAAILPADARRELAVVAASSEALHALELFQVRSGQGPCVDSFTTGEAVSATDLRASAHRWPSFVAAAARAGYASVHAMPLRLGRHRLGTLGLFGTTVGALGTDDLRLAKALGHVATVAILQQRTLQDATAIAEQLQVALDSRVVLEQAKGILGQTGGLDMEGAFELIRRYARDRNLRLSDVARSVVDRELPADLLLRQVARDATRPTRRPR